MYTTFIYKLNNNIISVYFNNFFFSFILHLFSIFLSILIVYIVLLIKIAFYTLTERKTMAAIQRRIGPNVIGLGGLLQPFADGLKLASKEMLVLTKSSHFLFFLAPIWSFLLSLTNWSILPFNSFGALANPDVGFLIILLLSSLNVYGLLLAGWASNSKYALFGAIRSSAQMISYDVVLVFSLMPLLFVYNTLNLLKIGNCSNLFIQFNPIIYILGFLPFSIMFLTIIVAETNRSPFDLPEAEAELVAGFNVEYSSFIFALFFLGEYSNIIVMSTLFVLFFGGAWGLFYPFSSLIYNWFIETICFSIKLFFVTFLFVWVRATFPRLRFDFLMLLCWEFFLPLTFGFLFCLPLYYI